MRQRKRGLQPLEPGATGCTLVFVPSGPTYQPLAALATLAGLYGRTFSGVCECYIQPGLDGDHYRTGVALGFDDGEPDDEWWGAFVDLVHHACAEDEEVRLDRDACAFTTAAELRASMVHAGTAGFEQGSAVWVSDPAGADPDSPFTVLYRNIPEQGE